MTIQCPTCGSYFQPAGANGVLLREDQARDPCWEALTAEPAGTSWQRRRAQPGRGRWFWACLLGGGLHLVAMAFWVYLLAAQSPGSANSSSPSKKPNPPPVLPSLEPRR
jgi:hypothetical protein